MGSTAQSHVINLFTLAIADGFVSPEELTLIYERGKDLGLNQAEIDDVIQNPHRVVFNPPASLVDAIAQLYDLACVVVTDGRVDLREVQVLGSFAQRFGIREPLIHSVVAALIEEVRAGTPREELVATLSREVGL
jgi:hypothetical protein